MLKFGFIGLTNFSEALCVNLLKKVNAMAYVSDSSIARVEFCGQHGAVPCELDTDVIDRADLILLSYENFVDLQATIYSILGNLTSQKIILDLSIISPAESQEISAMVKPTGAEYCDLAILNTLQEVESSQATILFGGAASVYLRIQEFLKLMAGNSLKTGNITSALSTKVCYNILYAQIQNGVNEMLIYASKAGVLADDVIDAVQASPIKNTFLEQNGKKIAKGDYSVKNKIKHVFKQLNIAHDFTLSNKIPMKGLEHTLKLYESAIDRKLENHDIAEVYTIVERASHS
ncbi:MAG: NAD(P)-dependent oxidoreductase [Clostridia bacterium]|nr:NAD(P)-dependent oxidoreductase [Clostridia bacterium]